MNLNKEQAETAITLSALVTTGMFAYRKLTEPEAPDSATTHPGAAETYRSLVGAAPPAPWGAFLKGAGSLYIGLAIIAAASPPLGGGFAILVGVSAFFGNIVAIRKDLSSTGYQTALGAGEAARVQSGEYKPATGGGFRGGSVTETQQSSVNAQHRQQA